MVRKTIKGQEYTYWCFYLANGRRNDEYLGPVNDPRTFHAMGERLVKSREAGQIADSVKTLSGAIEVLPPAARPRIAQAADQTLACAEGFGDVTKDALQELSALR